MYGDMAHGTSPNKDAPPARSKVERRRHPRALTDFLATLSFASGTCAAKVINLSLGGALLDLGKDATAATEASIAVGSRLSVTIRSRGGSGPITVGGVAVLWNHGAGPHPLLAVQFDDVSGDDSFVLDDLLEEALNAIRGRNGI
jgi:hypothetical protein